jgi:hypothetical protein
MASQTIEDIRKELLKIKALRKKTAQKLTAESLRLYKGFENMSIEQREKLTSAILEFASIAVKQLNRLIKTKE